MRDRIAFLAGIGSWIGKPRGWERVVRLIAPPERCRELGELVVEREGFVFRVQPGTPLGWNVLLFGTYEPELRSVFRSVLPEGGVAIDVGANIGWHTLLLARLVGTDGMVFGAEPNPSVRDRLESNIVLNRVANITVWPFAMGSSPGRSSFFGPEATDGAPGSGHLIAAATPAAPASGVLEVETRCLDAVVAELGISRLDLLKIDVEGFELSVLRGAEASIAKFRPQIIFEFNREYVARGEASVERFEAFFARQRYRLSALGRGGARPIESGAWPDCTDVWAVPS